MSAIRWCVVFVSRPTDQSLTCGVLRPQPRWSNWISRYRSGSNQRRRPGLVPPPPGPPWSATAALPAGFPDASQ
jgi:hypothetical protein